MNTLINHIFFQKLYRILKNLKIDNYTIKVVMKRLNLCPQLLYLNNGDIIATNTILTKLNKNEQRELMKFLNKGLVKMSSRQNKKIIELYKNFLYENKLSMSHQIFNNIIDTTSPFNYSSIFKSQTSKLWILELYYYCFFKN